MKLALMAARFGVVFADRAGAWDTEAEVHHKEGVALDGV